MGHALTSFSIPNFSQQPGGLMVTAFQRLVADYQLGADLATAYGRIEELRWRLR
jgi:hypothetical protein